jgi:hypothetical protein
MNPFTSSPAQTGSPDDEDPALAIDGDLLDRSVQFCGQFLVECVMDLRTVEGQRGDRAVPVDQHFPQGRWQFGHRSLLTWLSVVKGNLAREVCLCK